MNRWTFTRVLWLVWKTGMIGYSQDRALIGSALGSASEKLQSRFTRELAEVQARITAKKGGR